MIAVLAVCAAVVVIAVVVLAFPVSSAAETEVPAEI